MDSRKTLADFVFASKYARFLPKMQRRETYDEAVHRMMQMHAEKLRRSGVLSREASQQLEKAEAAIVDKIILASQRALQFGGAAILDKESRIYNCSYSFFDRTRFLAEAVWLLLCGCGVGFSVQKHHVAKLPRLRKPSSEVEVVRIGDSIEGWAEAFDALLMSYVNGSFTVLFDYSVIRPEGAEIKSSGARAPGPEPLRKALEAIRGVLDSVVAEQGGALRTVDAFDLVMHAATCVRAGGVRRSATIALFSTDDDLMAKAKTDPEWFKTNPQRSMANISALEVRDQVTWEQFCSLLECTKQFGEPGFLFSNSTETGTNPCAEIGLDPVNHRTGGTVWSFCNLTSVNVAACKTRDDFLNAVELAAFLGTVQATYTDVRFLSHEVKEVMERDALLGVSLTGMADNMALAFDPEVLQAGAAKAVETNRYWAARLGINPAARITTVKPEGTGSLVLGVGNGIHPHHARRYLRWVEGGKASDPLVAFMQQQIPEAVQPSAYNKDEYKIVFPIDLGDGPLWLKQDETAIGHLEKVVSVQRNWVRPGSFTPDLTHNVSNTIQVKPDEWDDVAEFIYKNRDNLAGVALMGASGDLDYPQAPFVAVPSDEEVQAGTVPEERVAVWRMFNHLRDVWKDVDFSRCVETTDNSAGTEVVACAGGACTF